MTTFFEKRQLDQHPGPHDAHEVVASFGMRTEWIATVAAEAFAVIKGEEDDG